MSDIGAFMPDPGFASFSSPPAGYDLMNQYNGSFSPSTVHVKDNFTYQLFMRYLTEKALSAFKWDMPDTWSKDYFLYTLYSWGYIAVLDTWQYGVCAQFPALEGYTMYYQPSHIVINNQWLSNVRRRIGYDAVLFKCMPDYRGVMDLISNFAAQKALLSCCFEVNTLNSNLSTVFGVKDKKMAENMQKLYDRIARGEPAVFYKKPAAGLSDDGNIWEVFHSDVKSNYIVSDLMVDMGKLEDQFDTWFGIPNANTDKRERLVTDEVNSNNAETASFAGRLLERFKESCEQVNSIFGAGTMSVDWSDAIKEVIRNGNTNPKGDDNAVS